MKPCNKQRILFLVQLPPPVHGASIMNKYIHDSTIINNEFSTQYLPLDFVDKIEDIGTISVKKILKMLLFTFKLISVFMKFRPNLVYFTISPFGGAFYRDAFFVFFIKLFRIKILYHLHGKGIEEASSNRLKRAIYRYVFNNTTVITLSKMLDYDIKKIHSGEIYHLPNGIEVNQIQCKGKLTDKIKILYLSNLVKTKGVLDLIKAIELLPQLNTNYSVDVIGNSADISIEYVRSIVKEKKLEKIINVLGPKYGQEKWKAFNESDIFVFPTHFKNECFPLVLLEAMQCENVVVSTNNGAIEEIIKDCGVVVPQKSPKELAKALEELLLNKEKIKTLKDKAVIKFKKQYTLETFEYNFVEILNSVLNENKA